MSVPFEGVVRIRKGPLPSREHGDLCVSVGTAILGTSVLASTCSAAPRIAAGYFCFLN